MEQKPVWPGWETVKLIGRGSFGAVYEIQRDVLGNVEKAALKVISIPQHASDIEEMYSDGYDDESITSTFQSHLSSIVAEYSLMRKMNGCANVVHCDDIRYVQHDDGIGWDIFIKMELLTPLTKVLPAKIPEEMVAQLAVDLCAALELCRKHDIVHRDIKPQNIFVSPNGDFKLGDFGIAKTVEKTMGGTKIGTYKYMAPEVYNNQPYGLSADIYSLGLVLYWLLNERRLPFLPLPPAKLSASMEDAARNRRFSGTPLPEPANGSKKIKAIVLKACAFDPSDRYHTADEMLKDLLEMGAGHGVRGKVLNAEQPNAGMLARIEEERLRQTREDEEAKRRAAEAQALERQKAEEEERLRREREELERLRREREALEAQRRHEEEQARLQCEREEQERLRREREAAEAQRRREEEQARLQREREEEERLRREREELERLRRERETLEAQRRHEEEQIRLQREREEREHLHQGQQNGNQDPLQQVQNAGDAQNHLLNDLALMRGERVESEQVRRERDESVERRHRIAEAEGNRKRVIDELALMRAEREIRMENRAESTSNDPVAPKVQFCLRDKKQRILKWSGISVAAVLLVVVLTYPLWRCAAFGHIWDPATDSRPDTCSTCGKTVGYSLSFTSTVKSISVAPLKLFYVGDRLTVDDFSVVAIYHNGINRRLPGTFTINVEEVKKAGKQTIAISYGGVTTYCTIHVYER